jgi:hypothetical protein
MGFRSARQRKAYFAKMAYKIGHKPQYQKASGKYEMVEQKADSKKMAYLQSREIRKTGTDSYVQKRGKDYYVINILKKG